MSPRSEISGSKSQLSLNQHQVNSTSNRSLNSVGLSKSAAGEEGSNNKMISDLFPTVGNKSGFEKEKDSTIERTPNVSFGFLIDEVAWNLQKTIVSILKLLVRETNRMALRAFLVLTIFG